MNALYMECSSKEMTGVHEIFETAINTVVAEQEGLLTSPPGTSAGESSRPKTSRKGSTAGLSIKDTNSTGVQQVGGMQLAPSRKKKRGTCKFL